MMTNRISVIHFVIFSPYAEQQRDRLLTGRLETEAEADLKILNNGTTARTLCVSSWKILPGYQDIL